MNEYFDDGMIALLPKTTDWCRADLPHLTIVYLGKVSEIEDPLLHNRLLKDTLALSLAVAPTTVTVKSVEEFGHESRVDVLLLDNPPILQQLNKTFSEWDKSEDSFTPHCTVGPKGAIVGLTVPDHLVFDRILVSWGEVHTTFKLLGQE